MFEKKFLVKILNRRVKLKDFILIFNVLFRKPVLFKFNIMYEES